MTCGDWGWLFPVDSHCPDDLDGDDEEGGDDMKRTIIKFLAWRPKPRTVRFSARAKAPKRHNKRR
jgi:hypothetical protein